MTPQDNPQPSVQQAVAEFDRKFSEYHRQTEGNAVDNSPRHWIEENPKVVRDWLAATLSRLAGEVKAETWKKASDTALNIVRGGNGWIEGRNQSLNVMRKAAADDGVELPEA